MTYNNMSYNLCNNTDLILENFKAMRAEQKYLPGTSTPHGLKKDSLEKNSTKNNIVADGNDDGKISFKEKAKNFGKGFIAPVKTMFSSPKNIAITAASAAIGTGLIILTSGAIAPLFVAAGLAGGGIQIGRGIYNQLNAKTDEEAKKAWQQMGSGTFTAGVSAAGAKSALKASGVSNTKDMSVFSAIIKCFKDIPKNTAKCCSSISGKFSSLSRAVTNTGNTSSNPSGSPQNKNSAPNSSDNIEFVEGEVVVEPGSNSHTNRYNGNNKPDIIDVDYVEVIDEPDIPIEHGIISETQGRISTGKTPEQITANKDPLLLEGANNTKPRQIGKKQDPLLLEGPKDSNTTPSQTSFVNKIKNIFKLFGFFKSDN